MSKYYSALTVDTALEFPALDKWEGTAGLAMAWDVAQRHGLPAEYAPCDVMYAEPPFPGGWEVFHDRVGRAPAMPYPEFIKLLTSFYLFRPGVLVLGHRATRWARQVTEPSDIQRVELHHAGIFANALWFGTTPTKDHLTTDAVLSDLAARYDTVGDFCSGYGNTGRVFSEAGKRFVLSDVNPRCVGFIKDQEWAR